jgi:hypothetical protein
MSDHAILRGQILFRRFLFPSPVAHCLDVLFVLMSILLLFHSFQLPSIYSLYSSRSLSKAPY